MEPLLSLLGVLLLFFIVLFYSAFSWGFVSFKFYGWFILSQFNGLPNISVIGFIGVILFIGVLTHRSTQSIKDEYKDKQMETSLMILSPWLSFFCGWIIHSFFF